MELMVLELEAMSAEQEFFLVSVCIESLYVKRLCMTTEVAYTGVGMPRGLVSDS